MKTIELTRGYVTTVDDDDFDWLSQWEWQVRVAPKKTNTSYYAMRTDRSGGKAVTVMMHRAIMRPPRGLYVDHIDGYGLNNSRGNLRLCNLSQNSVNRAYCAPSSGFRGVSLKERGNWRRWVAQITANGGKPQHLGYFKTPEEAARAYDEAAVRLHGGFAQLNFKEVA